MESSSEKVYWVLSNYSTHVQKHAKNSVKFASKFVMNLSTENHNATTIIHNEDGKLVETMEHAIDERIELDELDDSAEYIEDEQSDEESNYDSSIEIVEIYSMPQSNSGLGDDDLESLIYN